MSSGKQKKEKDARAQERAYDLKLLVVRGISNLILLAVTLYFGNFLIQDMITFDRGRAATSEGIAKKANEIRFIIDKAAVYSKAMHQKKLENTEEFRQEIEKYVQKIELLEDELLGNYAGKVRYFFGDQVSDKIRHFVRWTIASRDSAFRGWAGEAATNRRTQTIVFAMQLQMYSPHKCKDCKKIGSLELDDLDSYIGTGTLK